MAYGIRVTGADSNYQVDSTDSETEFLSIKDSGNLANSTVSASNYALGDLLMVGHANSSNIANSTKEIKPAFNSSGLSPTLANGGDFLIFRSASTHTLDANQTESYGLKVFNQSGIVCFDSRNLTKGLEITKVWGRTARDGGYPTKANGTVDSAWVNNSGNEVYSGANLGNVYVSCAGSAQGTGYSFMSFKYIYDSNGTSGKIKLINAYTFLGGAWLGTPNLQQIIVGRFIE
tara:strand:- start:416 stop:1111 length:696 start_codon:yes stop_codon:yes gene_type:complete